MQRKAKTRKLGSNFLGQRAAGRTKEVVSAQAQKSVHTGTEATSATSMEQEVKNLSNHLKDSCKWGFSRLVSLLDPSPCRPASLTGLALPTLPSLHPVWQTHCPPEILVTRHTRLEDVISSRVPFTPRATSLLFSSSLSSCFQPFEDMNEIVSQELQITGVQSGQKTPCLFHVHTFYQKQTPP